jgi:HD-like signal output (HDOD) protein
MDMTKTLPDWVKLLSNCEIPVLHKSKRKIYNLQQDDKDITFTVLSDIARQDLGFAITLLRYAGRDSKKEITSVYHAVSLISIPIVIKMLADLPELEKVVDKKHYSKIIEIYTYQYHVACIAKEWSIQRKESEHDENFTAALNRGFFSFMLYLIEPELANQVEKNYFADPKNHVINEKKLLGYSLDELSEEIANRWKLPELIRESYSGKHHNPKITGARLASDLMHQIFSHASIQYPADLIKRVAEYMRVPVETAPGKINRIIIDTIRHSYKSLPYQPLLLIMMSYPSSIKKQTVNVKDVVKENNNIILSDCINTLRSRETIKSALELIEITMLALKEGIGFSRVLFMPFNKKENCLDIKFQSLNKELKSIKPLRVYLELNKLFSQITKKEQTLCINPKNQHKFSTLLPEKLRPMKNNATIIINSFYANNKMVGCFYMDHGSTNKQLSANDLKNFKVICTELKRAIEFSFIKENPSKKVA